MENGSPHCRVSIEGDSAFVGQVEDDSLFLPVQGGLGAIDDIAPYSVERGDYDVVYVIRSDGIEESASAWPVGEFCFAGGDVRVVDIPVENQVVEFDVGFAPLLLDDEGVGLLIGPR